ncbi:MAG: Rieske (2Fe-2S) protein [Cyanobacteria bacterium]|nr:Rieske (2Fe-2S) protein [Cyanobacteriota bacterium]
MNLKYLNRRYFLSWLGFGGLVAALQTVIAACAPKPNTTADAPSAAPTDAAPATAPEATSATDAGLLTVGTLADLDAQGSLVVESPEKVIVVRDPDNADGVLALTANCNHKNCTVGWSADSSQFICPCHESKFALDGTLLEGPATEPLQPLVATVDGDTILVTL